MRDTDATKRSGHVAIRVNTETRAANVLIGRERDKPPKTRFTIDKPFAKRSRLLRPLMHLNRVHARGKPSVSMRSTHSRPRFRAPMERGAIKNEFVSHRVLLPWLFALSLS
jgi:hypothetical protein